jgi:hypothetical protein
MRILICASDAPFAPTNTGFRRQLMGLVPEIGRRHDVRLIGYRMPDQSKNPAVEADMRIVDYEKPGAAENARDLGLAMIRRRPLRAERLVRGLREPLREELARFKPDLVHVGPGKLSGLKHEIPSMPRVLMPMDAWTHGQMLRPGSDVRSSAPTPSESGGSRRPNTVASTVSS